MNNKTKKLAVIESEAIKGMCFNHIEKRPEPFNHTHLVIDEAKSVKSFSDLEFFPCKHIHIWNTKEIWNEWKNQRCKSNWTSHSINQR